MHLWDAMQYQEKHIRAAKPLQEGQEHRASRETCHGLRSLSQITKPTIQKVTSQAHALSIIGILLHPQKAG